MLPREPLAELIADIEGRANAWRTAGRARAEDGSLWWVGATVAALSELPAPIPERINDAWLRTMAAGVIDGRGIADRILALLHDVLVGMADETVSELRAAIKETP